MPPPQHIEMAATAAAVGARDADASRARGKFIFTITNDKGRLSKEEIDAMVNETKKYKIQR
jgi:hypothetical protein